MLPVAAAGHIRRLPRCLWLPYPRCFRDEPLTAVRSSVGFRRDFTTTACSAAPPARRQRPRQSRKPSPPQTLRERRLRLVRENIYTPKPRAQRARELLATAQGRLAWLRDRLYAHWNPDLAPAAALQSSTSAASASAATTVRARRVAIRMDARWWAWNVAFALLPAVAIGLYCEFYGKYIVHDYHTHKELESMRRLLGEDFVRQHAEELLPPPPDNLWTRVLRLGREIQTWIANDEKNVHANDPQSEDSHQDTSVQPRQLSDRQPSPPQSGTRGRSGQAAAGLASASSATISPKSSPGPLTDGASTQVLVERIQKLEERLNQQMQNQHSPPAITAAQQHQLEYQVERLDQSDIRNRMEDEKIIMWRKRIADKQKQRQLTSVPEGSKQAATALGVDQDVRHDENTQRSHDMSAAQSSHSVWAQTMELLWPRMSQQNATNPTTGASSASESGETASGKSEPFLAKADGSGPVDASLAARSVHEESSGSEPAKKGWRSLW